MNIISLTTIPPRFNKIDATLRSLINQKADIEEIRLYIPKKYRRFSYSHNDVPRFSNKIRVILTDNDFGPATKIMPAALDLANTCANILFCDDDHIYPDCWATTLLSAWKERPDCCIVQRGYDLGQSYHLAWRAPENRLLPRAYIEAKDARYRLLRIASLGLHKPSRMSSGYVDVFMGYAGALLRASMIPPEAYDIPDHLWAVDDPWISSHLTRNGVPIWMQATRNIPKKTPATHIEALMDFSHMGRNRSCLDAACIAYFKNTYGMYNTIDLTACPPYRNIQNA